jgi:hypothetical protein
MPAIKQIALSRKGTGRIPAMILRLASALASVAFTAQGRDQRYHPHNHMLPI